MEQEPDPRVKAVWEPHLDMEPEHLRPACDLMRRHDGRDPEQVVAPRLPDVLTFEPNKESKAAAGAARRGKPPDRFDAGHRAHRAGADRGGHPAVRGLRRGGSAALRPPRRRRARTGPVPGTVVLRRVAARSVLEGSPDVVIGLGEPAVYPEHSPRPSAWPPGGGCRWR
ncbi:hypothetical protein [Streptomyces sparsogenes]|uniref:hypothetical protein n=1 Tax=Streptomyces sparsogenes TaxID=67365 RepID=UPI003F4CB654